MTIKDIACGVNHNPPWQLSPNWHGLPFPQLPIRAFSLQSKSHRQTGPTGLFYLGMVAGSAKLGLFIVAVGYPTGFAAGGAAALVALALFLLLMRGHMVPQRPA